MRTLHQDYDVARVVVVEVVDWLADLFFFIPLLYGVESLELVCSLYWFHESCVDSAQYVVSVKLVPLLVLLCHFFLILILVFSYGEFAKFAYLLVQWSVENLLH